MSSEFPQHAKLEGHWLLPAVLHGSPAPPSPSPAMASSSHFVALTHRRNTNTQTQTQTQIHTDAPTESKANHPAQRWRTLHHAPAVVGAVVKDLLETLTGTAQPSVLNLGCTCTPSGQTTRVHAPLLCGPGDLWPRPHNLFEELHTAFRPPQVPRTKYSSSSGQGRF